MAYHDKFLPQKHLSRMIYGTIFILSSVHACEKEPTAIWLAMTLALNTENKLYSIYGDQIDLFLVASCCNGHAFKWLRENGISSIENYWSILLVLVSVTRCNESYLTSYCFDFAHCMSAV